MTAPASDTEVVVLTEAPGGGRLAIDAMAGATPPNWYPPRPRDARGWSGRAAAVRAQAATGDWIQELWPAIGATGPAAERLRLAAEGGVVVTTGQQPGLFGGPIYTWSKAMSVLALADALERVCGMPVAPLFWAATDDTDFDEASTTWVHVPGGVEAITVRPVAPRGTVLAGAPLADTRAALTSLTAAAGSARYAGALEAVRAAYGGGGTAGASYVELLRRLLEPLGVAVLDAAHGAVRRRAFPVLRAALERADDVEAALAQRRREITTAGYRPQVRDVDDLSTVFMWDQPAGVGSDAVSIGAIKSRVPRSRAAERATRAQPGDLSPNVVLRPVVERAILPTVAYVAGPAELAYFAQSTAVADALDAPPPLAVPRWSGTLLEPATSRLMARYGVSIPELVKTHGAEQRVARAALPPALRDALDGLAADVERAIEAVARSDADGLLSRSVIEGARAHLGHRLLRFERRFLAAVKRRETTAMRELATIRGALRPNGQPQERVLNFMTFLARGGPGLLDAMRAQAAHHIATLVGGESSNHP